MAQFQDIFGNFLWSALIIFGLLSVIFIVQSNNSAEQPLSENELIGGTHSNLLGNLSNLEGTSEAQYNLFSTEKPPPGLISIVLKSILTVGKTFGAVIFGFFSLILKIPLIVLGIPATVTAMLVSFLTISVIIALWLIYKFGGG